LLKVEGPEQLDKLSKVDQQVPAKKELLKWEISITESGLKVFNNKEDFIHLNGIDRWLGGVHLQGKDSRWRWDETTQELFEFGL
jgi:hypothetical protein